MNRAARVAVGAGALALLLWAALPGARAVALVARRAVVEPMPPAGLAVEEVEFSTADGVRLAGWFVAAASEAPSLILVHGFKSSRIEMLPWARMLHDAGYNVLLFDSRGCGASDGWGIALGAREHQDVIAAVRYLRQRPDLRAGRIGAIGLSLGAGVVLRAAAREPGLGAVVADSAWTDQDYQLDRLRTARLGGFELPQLAYAPALVNALVGAAVEDARPIDDVARIAPRGILFIHAVDDANATTPPSGARALFEAAREPKQLWLAPRGGHAGALAANPEEYRERLIAFVAEHLGVPSH